MPTAIKTLFPKFHYTTHPNQGTIFLERTAVFPVAVSSPLNPLFYECLKWNIFDMFSHHLFDFCADFHAILLAVRFERCEYSLLYSHRNLYLPHINLYLYGFTI